MQCEPGTVLQGELADKLDDSEDMVVSQSLRDLVGQRMMEFCAGQLKSQVPATLREAVQQITRPEGVRRKDTGQRDTLYIPEDEGAELFDGNGTDIPADVDVDDEITASDEEDDTSVVTSNVQEEMEGDENSDSGKNQSESAAAADTPMFSDSLTSKLKILQEFSDLLRQKRLLLNSNDAGGTMIAVFNTIQTTISNGRKKLLTEEFRKTDDTLVSHLTAVACDQNLYANSAVIHDASETSPMQQVTTSPMEQETQSATMDVLRLSIGDYILVKCGEMEGNNLPACITAKNPTAVLFFSMGPNGLYSANEDEHVASDQDIICNLPAPTAVQRGTRVYYKFELNWMMIMTVTTAFLCVFVHHTWLTYICIYIYTYPMFSRVND